MTSVMKDYIQKITTDSIETHQKSIAQNQDKIIQAVDLITKAFKSNHKVLFFGNGGSAADSQHIAAEFIGRFQKERRALPAIALTTDSSILTCLSNDYSFNVVFARQIEALGVSQDVAFGISTSGNSANVIEGLKKAKELGLKTIALTGCGGGKMAGLADVLINVPSNITARIQESHMCMYHLICDLVEQNFS